MSDFVTERLALTKTKLSSAETDYLESFLDAGDRGGFYQAYYAMVSPADTSLFAQSVYGKREASFQTFVSTFSGGVGATAYLSNRLLQEALPAATYDSIYTYSQSVAHNALAGRSDTDIVSDLAAGGSGLISDDEMLDTAFVAWADFGLSKYFPAQLLQSDAAFSTIVAAASALGAWLSDFASANFRLPSRSEVIDWALTSEQSGARLAILTGIFVGWRGIPGKRISDFAGDSNYQIIDSPDGNKKLAVRISDGHVVAIETNSAFSSGQSWFEALGNNGHDAIVALASIANLIPPALVGLGVTSIEEFVQYILDPVFIPILPAGGWKSLSAPVGEDPSEPTSVVPNLQTPTAFGAEPTAAGDTLNGHSKGLLDYGVDTLDGGGGDDTIFGASGNDSLTGGLGDDILWGQGDDDTLVGGVGDDVLRGGAGNDLLRPGDGNNLVDGGDPMIGIGGDGADAVEYTDLTIGDRIRIQLGTNSQAEAIDVRKGVIDVRKVDGSDAEKSLDHLVGIDVIKGTAFGDAIDISGLIDYRQIANIKLIDLGAEAGGFVDGIIAAGAATGVIVDLRNHLNQTVSANALFAPQLHVANVEGFRGSAFDDVFYGVQDQVVNVEIYGGSGKDIIYSGAGVDYIDGEGDADTIIVGAGDILARGEKEDRLYLGSLDASNILIGGTRTVVVNDAQTLDQQIQAMLTSPLDFNAQAGVRYQITGSGETQGLAITLPDGATVTIERWEEGEYGIVLETTKNNITELHTRNYGLVGPVSAFGSPGTVATFLVNGVQFAAAQAYDPNWGDYAGDRFSLNMLRLLAGQPGQPPRSNNLQGTDSADTINGRTTDDRMLGLGGNDALQGFLGNDRLDGGDGNDILEGGFGSDTIVTGDGRDTVVFNTGDGVDLVIGDTDDVIRFGSGIAPSQVTLSTGSSSESAPGYGELGSGDVILSLGTSDSIRIQDGAFGSIEFADGTVNTIGKIAREAIADSATAGDDVVTGFATADVLRGGAGNDYLNGFYGDDRYYFGIGDGHDRVEDSFGFIDRIVLGAGITPENLVVTSSQIADGPRAGEILARMSVAGTDDWIEFVVRDIEEVHFADGTTWNQYDVGSRVYGALATSGDDHLTIQNIIYGVFRPGAGDDVISVGNLATADVQFGRGSELDRFELSNDGDSWAGRALVTLDPDVSLGDLRFQRLGGDGLLVTIAGTDDRIELARFYDSALQSDWRTFDFVLSGEGFSLSTPEIESLADIDAGTAVRQVGTSGNDTLTGTAGGDILAGGAGADTLNGGDGIDLLYGGAGNDILNGGTGRDMIYGELGDDQLDGGAGDDFLDAGGGSNTLLGGLGNDELYGSGQSTLNGGAGDDRIHVRHGDLVVHNLGDGNDTVYELLGGSTLDGSTTVERMEISLGTGIDPATTTLTLEGWTVYVNVNGSTSERIRLDRVFQGENLPQIRFADGTIWRETEILGKLFSPNNGSSTATGLVSDQPGWGTIAYVYGGGGDEILSNQAVDVQFADQLYYVFAPGSGHDEITGTRNASLLLYGFDPDQMSIARSGTALADMTLSFAGTSDTIKIKGQQRATGGSVISSFVFSGETLGASDIRERWIAQSTTAGDDIITGFDGPGGYIDTGIIEGVQFFPAPGNDRLQGGSGNDTMIGGSGDDTYVVHIGDGIDIIRDVGLFSPSAAAGYDILSMNALSTNAIFKRSTIDTNDLVITFSSSADQITIDQFYAFGSIEEFEFGDGVVLTTEDVAQLALGGSATAANDAIIGTALPETLTGGAGNDTLNGLAGSDRYVFNLGDGQDVITDTGTAEANTLAFGAGISASQVTFQKVGNDLKAIVNGNDSITITGQFSGAAIRRIDQVVFADGTRKSAAEIDQLALAQLATSGNDTITGFASNDTISGGGGNDTLNGAAGNDVLIGGNGNDTLNGQQGADVYVISRGDGVDQINSSGDVSALDTIQFDATIGSRDVEFVRATPTSPHLIINVRGTSQSITVANYFSGPAISAITFADGTTLSSAGVLAALANAAPTATAEGWRPQVDEGGTTQFGIPLGLFSDGSATSELTFQATLADGSPLPSWLSFDGEVFESTANDAQVGTYAIKLTAIDRFGASVSRTFKFDINNSDEAPVSSGTIATQAAPIGTAFTFAVPGTLFSDDDSFFATTPAVQAGTYATVGGGSIIVQANGDYAYTPLSGFTDLDEVYLPFAIGSGAAIERPFTIENTGSALSGTLPADLAPAKDTLTLTARLASGDPLPSWLTFNGSTFSGTPASGDAGPLAVEIVATDSTGLTSVVPLSIRVGTSNQTPTASAIATIHATEDAAFNFAIPAAAFADADLNDRLTLTATLADNSPLPSWLTFDGTTFAGTPGNEAVGNLSIKVTATDISGAAVSNTFSLVVDNTNDAPVAGTPIADQLAQQDQPFSYVIPLGSFVDPDAGDGLTISVSQANGLALPSWLTYAGGVLSGTPGNDDSGLVRLRATATDASGAKSYQDFWVGVQDVNDAPTVTGSLETLSAPVHATTVFPIPSGLFADSDDAGFQLTATLADGSPLPSWIAYDPDFQTFTLDPWAEQFFGKDAAESTVSLRITATDPRGGATSTTFDVRVVAPDVTDTITGSGSNAIYGTDASERIDSGPGDNVISGAGGVDRIVFGRGSGQDQLERGTFGSDYPYGDIVEFGPDVVLADVSFTRVNSGGGNDILGYDLLVKINGTTDQLSISEQFAGLLGEEATVREFVFADGSRLSAAQVLAMLGSATGGNDTISGGNQADVLNGGGGNDTIVGFDGDDVIDGGAGNDTLIGDQRPEAGYHGLYGGGDTFLFGRGSGNDLVFADDLDGAEPVLGVLKPTNGVDTLRFGPDILPSDLIITHLPGYPDDNRTIDGQDAGALLIQISGTSDSIKIDRQFFIRQFEDGAYTPGIERFEFADGTVMNRAQFESLITLAPTTAGDDLIAGGAGADLLAGGLGNDTLVGEEGADRYVYNPGDGDDRILETMQVSRATPSASPTARAGDIISSDAISFGAGISPDEIIFTRPDADGENLVITFRDHAGSITIEGQFRNILHGGDVFNALNVSDYYGVENAAIDEFRFADGTTWSLSDIYAYSVRATAGDDVIDGFFRPSETLDGGAGNDLLVGRNGDDTYVFARGYGNDTIKEFGYLYSDGRTSGDVYVAGDKIKFVGVASTDVTTSIGEGGSFIFRINDTGETLTIRPESEFNNFTSIIFSNTTWNAAQFQARWTLASATSGDDTIYGFVGNDTISGGDGNDILGGGQNTGTPQTGLGYDTLNGGLGNDTLILNSSDNDRANGNDGDDTFRFVMSLAYWTNSTSTVLPARGALGYPNSVVAYGTEKGVIDGGIGTDTLVLGGKLSDYWRGTNYVTNNGDGSYTFKGGLRVSGIETVQFADGTLAFSSLAAAVSQYRPNPVEGTSGNDVMNGTSGNDALYGLGGNDTLNGLDGNDFLIGGDGADTYNGGNGTDFVDYSYDSVGWSINLTTGQAVQSATTETLTSIEGAYGSSAADTLTGSGNADTLSGGGGDDTIAANGGNDVIEFDGGAGGYDAVDAGLGTDTIRAMSQDTVIGLSSVAGVEAITANGFTGVIIQGSSVANTLDFSATTLTGIVRIDGGGGNDTITGSAAADTFDGGAGDDALNGGSGNDVFTVSGTSGGFDSVTGGADFDSIVATSSSTRIGLTAISQIEAVSSGGNSGVYISGSTNADTLDFTNVTLTGITKIDGGSGNDTITGSSAADVILGSGGDDSLSGGQGDDVFQYSGASNGFDNVSGGAGTNSISALANSTVIGLSALSGIQSISGGSFTGVSIAGSGNADTLDFSAVTLTAITKIDGGGGNDTITGSAGANTIQGSGGDDTLSGGAGNDIFQYTGSSGGFDAVSGGADSDTITALAASTVIGLSSISGIETITAGGFSSVTIAGSGSADTLDFTGVTLTGIVSINGGVGNDVITGSAAADTILGGADNDTLSGGDGNDTLNGGAGTNILNGGLGTDVAQYSGAAGAYSVSDNGNGTYTLSGSGVSDTLADIENLSFSDGTVTVASRVGLGLTLTGTASAETITGGGNADIITGLGGNDTLIGNGGDDTFRVTGTGDGFDNVDGGGGNDTITATVNNAVIGLSAVSGIEIITAGGFTGVSISGTGNNDTLNFAATTLTSIVKIDGGAGADAITGSAGADTILGSGGDDTLSGSDGNDTFQYTGTANGFDALDGGLGTDTITALANSTIIGLTSISGIEAISAGSFTGVSIAGSTIADTLDFTGVTLTAITKIDGGGGNDTITGSAGADTLLGSGGDDTVNGGDGNDTIQYTGTANGFDAVTGGLGTDTISALANSTVIGLTSISGIETITAGSFTGVYIAGSGNNDTLDFTGMTLTAITKIDGGGGNDTIVGTTAANTILGSGGDDTINAGSGNDTIQYTGTSNGFDAVDGGDGTDTISALANNTVIGLSALAGVETISAGSFTGVYVAGSGNNDTLNFSAVTLTAIVRVEGGAGHDTLTGNSAANTLWGGLGNDIIDGGTGNDSLLGDDGDDTIKGAAGTDTMNGGIGTDTADYSAYSANLTVNLATATAQTVASGDSDTITNIENVTGGSGTDTLTGSTLNNVIDGGSGNDRLTGSAGNDTIIGGVGTSDVAVFAGLQASYTIATNAGVVTITDNQPTTDGNDGVDTVSGIEKAEFKGGVQVGITSPIVLDLDGDGVSLVANQQSNVGFDWDGDGTRNQTGWVGEGDGFLVFDRDGNGTVSNGGELSFTADKPGAKSDLDGLQAFDSNGDGLFSSDDDKFDEFKVWRDANGNGRADSGEVLSLADAGVASIGLAGDAVNQQWGWGENITINNGSYTRTDGSVAAFGDVALSYEVEPSRGVAPFGGRGGLRHHSPHMGGIHSAAARFGEAIAGFGADRGMHDAFEKHDWLERRELVLAASHAM